MKGRFNLFQAAMLRWRALHPYNAVHVLAIELPLDRVRLAAVIDEVLEGSGLTGFVLDARARRYAYQGGPARTVVEVVDGGKDPLPTVSREVETWINHAFPEQGAYQPFRFFAVEGTTGFHLGIAYDHPLAGGDSIAALLGEIAERFAHDAARADPLTVLDRYPPTYTRLLARHWKPLLRGLARLPAIVAGGRNSVRPRLPDSVDGSNGFTRFAVTGPQYRRLEETARSWGMSVNDLLLAVILRAVASLAPQRARQRRRRLAAVASIVNLRADYVPDVGHTFGQFLSSIRVAHPVPDGQSLQELASDVHAQVREARRDKLYLQTLLVIGLSALGWRFLDEARRRGFYFKYNPILAGVTPLNVNALRRRGRCADGAYLRAASTGPLSPMVFATTLSGAAIQVGITFRRAAVARASVDSLIASITRCMETLQ